MNWQLLIISLPTENATARMRIWRALRTSGAAVLRDGVYLMPERPACRKILESLADKVRAAGGVAFLVRAEEPGDGDFRGFFDRGRDYAALLADMARMRAALNVKNAKDALRQSRKFRKTFAALTAVDFFPDEAQRQAETALSELELAVARILSPDEPRFVAGAVARLALADYRAKTWATRRRPWADRLACAWLIRRFIDPEARLLWLASPDACPADAIGFDFDGARFSHVNGRVTFEVLLASFDLETAALKRLAGIVHFLDAGGIQPPEAAGVESVLAGLRAAVNDDDRLVVAADTVFDGLLTAFEQEAH